MAFDELKRFSAAISWPRTIAGWLHWVVDSLFVGAVLGGGIFNLLVLMAVSNLGDDPINWVAMNMAFALFGIVFRAGTTVWRLGFTFKGPAPTQWAVPKH